MEVRSKLKAAHQYRPAPLALVREIWKARVDDTALLELVMKDRHILSDEVRSEGKLLVSLSYGGERIGKVSRFSLFVALLCFDQPHVTIERSKAESELGVIRRRSGNTEPSACELSENIHLSIERDVQKVAALSP